MKPVRFIADIHLSEDLPNITTLFVRYLREIAIDAEALYILGDLFAMWLGDDLIGQYEQGIANEINQLSQSMPVYFMPGNRDFLLGQTYANLSGMCLLKDPATIMLDGQRVLLKHGDDLCTRDKSHQWFRKMSQNKWVKALFLSLPATLRRKIGLKLRQKSAKNQKAWQELDVVTETLMASLTRHNSQTIIHGHIHYPKVSYLKCKESVYRQLVLSDWRTKMTDLCYIDHNYRLNFY